MNLRKCGTHEALEAAKICGYDDEHGLKRAFCYGSVSNADIFVDLDDNHKIYVADKDGNNAVYAENSLR